MKMTAMLSYGTEQFVAKEVILDEIDDDEVLVKIKAVGICHTDIASTKSIYPFSYPVVLGHEGAGIVEKVGKNVINVAPGDHVVLVYDSCGKCENCIQGMPYICDEFYHLNTQGVSKCNEKKLSLANGEKVSNFFGQSSFAEYSIVHQNSVVKVDKELPLEYLGPLACGFLPECKVTDFPLRDRKMTLIVKRRRWKDEKTGESISNDYKLVAEGTRHSVEFAAFLKEVLGQIPDSGFFA